MNIAQKLAHLFFPRLSNNHRPKILHNSSLFLIAFAFVSLQAVMEIGLPRGGVLSYATNINPDEIIRLTNEKRVENGLNPLSYNGTLAQAALAKGNDMINKNYWAHVAPDGTQPWAFFLNAGYKYKYAGENLARDFNDSSATVNAWMASPSHRENMLSPNYKEIGVAVVNGSLTGSETTLVVQFFGTKITDTIPVAAVAAAEKKIIASPSPSPIALAQTQTIVGQKVESQPALFSPFDVTRSVSLAVVVLLLAVMIADYIIVRRRNISRVGGRPFAHIAFMGMVALLIILAKVGRII